MSDKGLRLVHHASVRIENTGEGMFQEYLGNEGGRKVFQISLFVDEDAVLGSPVQIPPLHRLQDMASCGHVDDREAGEVESCAG